MNGNKMFFGSISGPILWGSEMVLSASDCMKRLISLERGGWALIVLHLVRMNSIAMPRMTKEIQTDFILY